MSSPQCPFPSPILTTPTLFIGWYHVKNQDLPKAILLNGIGLYGSQTLEGPFHFQGWFFFMWGSKGDGDLVSKVPAVIKTFPRPGGKRKARKRKKKPHRRYQDLGPRPIFVREAICEIKMTETLKLDLSKHGSIPKTIHVSWKTKNILNDQSPVILNGLSNLKKLNPDYALEISDDNDVEMYLKSRLKKWDYIKIKNKKIVEKIDLWRLLKIYNEGGIYVDIDRFCNISFDNIIKSETKCILPTHGDIDFSQDLMISCKGNPIFKKAIEYNLATRFLINPRGVFHLGPPIYMRAVTESVFGSRTKRKPGRRVMENFRKLLHNSKHFQTYKEIIPNDTLLFKYNEKTFQIGNGLSKKEFYDSQDITPWSSGHDKNTVILLIILSIVVVAVYIIIRSVADNV